MKRVSLPVIALPHYDGLPLPHYATEQSAGCDLVAAVESPWTLRPMERRAVPCGICIALPEGYEAQVRPRSGLALKRGVTVANAPGTVDADYRGEIHALLVNLGQEDFTITRGMRIAQLIVAPVVQALWEKVESLDETARGAGGFGSTGLEAEKA